MPNNPLFPKEIYLQGNLRLFETRTSKDARFSNSVKQLDPGPTQRPNNSIPLLFWIQERIEQGDLEIPCTCPEPEPPEPCDCDLVCEEIIQEKYVDVPANFTNRNGFIRFFESGLIPGNFLFQTQDTSDIIIDLEINYTSLDGTLTNVFQSGTVLSSSTFTEIRDEIVQNLLPSLIISLPTNGIVYGNSSTSMPGFFVQGWNNDNFEFTFTLRTTSTTVGSWRDNINIDQGGDYIFYNNSQTFSQFQTISNYYSKFDLYLTKEDTTTEIIKFYNFVEGQYDLTSDIIKVERVVGVFPFTFRTGEILDELSIVEINETIEISICDKIKELEDKVNDIEPCDCEEECTLVTGECCDYRVEGINFCLETFRVDFKDFEIEEGQFLQAFIGISNIPPQSVFLTADDVFSSVTNRQELLENFEQLYLINLEDYPEWVTYIFDETGISVIIDNCNSEESTLTLGFALNYVEELEDIKNTFLESFQSTYSEIQEFSGVVTDKPIYELTLTNPYTKQFQVRINGSWTTIDPEQIQDGVWEETYCDGTEVTDWRITVPADNDVGFIIVDSGEVEKTCSGGETETKTKCEWLQDHEDRITELENNSNVGENLYNSDGTLNNNRVVTGAGYKLDFISIRSMLAVASPQNNDPFAFAFGNYVSGSPAVSLAGIILGGSGKHQGIVLNGETDGTNGTGSYGLQLNGVNNNPTDGDDIEINPNTGRLRFTNIPTGTPTEYYGINSDGRLIRFTPPSIALPKTLVYASGNAQFTGATTESLVFASAAIPASKWKTNSPYDFRVAGRLQANQAQTAIIRVYLNTVNTFTGTPILIHESYVATSGTYSSDGGSTIGWVKTLWKRGNNILNDAGTSSTGIAASIDSNTTTANAANNKIQSNKTVNFGGDLFLLITTTMSITTAITHIDEVLLNELLINL